MSRRLRLLTSTLLVGVAIAAFAVFGLASDHSAVAGRPAPQLPRERLAGTPTTLAGLLAAGGGRPVLVVFWASWCGPCASEAPELERFSKTETGKGRIVGVDWSDPEIRAARAFIRHYGWSFPNVRDPEGLVGNAYHMTDLPTTFVLDARGRIRGVLRGPQNERSLTTALGSVERS
jgi:thiol-disulfide isomerase/thioredoxin